MKGALLIHCLLLGFVLSAQKNYSDEIRTAFKTGTYDLVRSEFYTMSGASEKKALQHGLVIAGFEAKSFTEYADLFLPGECHVTEEGWQNWKDNLGRHKPVILANFFLEKEADQYCVTKYALRYDGKEYLVAQVHKQVNGKWYYLSLEENVERMDVVMFFTTLREQFFVQWSKDRLSLSSDRILFDDNTVLSGGELTKIYNARFRTEHPAHGSVNLIFEDRVKSVNHVRSSSDDALITYFRNASLPATETEYLNRLVNASQRGEAIMHFSKLTGKPLSKIVEECPNAVVQ